MFKHVFKSSTKSIQFIWFSFYFGRIEKVFRSVSQSVRIQRKRPFNPTDCTFELCPLLRLHPRHTYIHMLTVVSIFNGCKDTLVLYIYVYMYMHVSVLIQLLTVFVMQMAQFASIFLLLSFCFLLSVHISPGSATFLYTEAPLWMWLWVYVACMYVCP